VSRTDLDVQSFRAKGFVMSPSHAIIGSIAGQSSATGTLNPVDLMSAALAHLASALSPVGGAVAAIVVLTLAVRLALHPLTRAAVRGERVRARLAPRLAELRQRHGSDFVRLSEETQSLYRSEQISPFVGVLPLLVQLPMIFILYRVFSHGDGPLAAAHLFGVSLHAHLLASLGSGGALLVFGVVLAVLAGIAWGNARRSAMIARVAAVPVAAGAIGALGRMAPYFLLVSGIILPLAAGIYLVTTTAWSLAENSLLRRGLP
jgi:YidC/Oxa1 family membrane protein insertase